MATISLYFDKKVPDELKAIFIEYAHRHLARYGCEVSRDRRYVCPDCGKPVKDLDAVRKRLAAKKDFITCQECDEKVPLMDFIEQRLKSDPVARKILAMDETATRELDTQALEQILIGHMTASAGEANQIFRPVTMFDHGIDGEVECKDDDGKASGKRIYIQLKSGNSYLRNPQGRRQRGLRREGRAPPLLLGEPAGGRVSRHPPDGRDGRRANHPLDERDALSQGAEGQAEPVDPLHRREARHGGGVEGAGWVLSAKMRGKSAAEYRASQAGLSLRHFATPSPRRASKSRWRTGRWCGRWRTCPCGRCSGSPFWPRRRGL